MSKKWLFAGLLAAATPAAAHDWYPMECCHAMDCAVVDKVEWDWGTGSVPASGATAGTPGSWTPAGATPPANLAACTGLTASPATAWSTGQYVVTGDAQHAHWSGSAWATGDAA